MMKFLRYFVYLIILSTAGYYVTKYVTYDKKLLSMVLGFILMFIISFPLLCLEFLKFRKKINFKQRHYDLMRALYYHYQQ
uniref:Uncharacterized protein n=1 Tax=Halalkalibacterium halodurans TaxID=86665 RepID=A0A0M0KD48_ALKHA